MSRPRSYDDARPLVAELAARREGVSAPCLMKVMRCSQTHAYRLLMELAPEMGLVRGSVGPGRTVRLFPSQAAAEAYARAPKQHELYCVPQLAARPRGVTVEDVCIQRDCHPSSALRLIQHAERQLPLYPSARNALGIAGRWFADQAHRDAWDAAAEAGQPEPSAEQLGLVPPRTVSLWASPLPPVPGWRSGPVLRPGALDFRQHQRQGRY